METMDNDRMSELVAVLERLLPLNSPVFDDLTQALGDAEIRTFYVRPETIFDADSVYERVVVFAASVRRLFLIYTDTSYEMNSSGELVTTAQAVDLQSIKEHHVVRRRQLAGNTAGQLNSVLLRLRWGAAFAADLHPGACDDPMCTNDHGYLGALTNEDFQIYLEAVHDGAYFQPGVDFINELVAMLGQR
ncbi:hypothetical protein SAMN04489737_1485 [Arcanobacterium phocae]|uniref:Uncharacterized protein n=2 Tax=Arcanobacterium phocae TaxID=131112 RepID=A0A1H2LKF2_9ACTO|nr:hypothetical protein SAMN04489737_1485 [Arcanobacterium phocae]